MNAKQSEKYEAIRAELISLRAKLKTEHQAVTDLLSKYSALCCTAAGGDEEAAREATALHALAEQSKAKIEGFKILIGRCEADKAPLDKIIMAEATQRLQEAAKEKWQAIRDECRGARARVERLKKEVDVLTKEAGAAQEVFEHAQARLDEHRATPADPLGLSPTELDRARRRDAELLVARNEALKQRNNANANKGSRFAEWQAAGQELGRLATVERLNCPPDVAKAKVPATIGEALQTVR